jgi:hypothetical protein
MDVQQPQHAINIDQILSPSQQAILSYDAQRLYEAVWHQMRIKCATTIWLNDIEASRRSRTIIQHIPTARVELMDRGLLECKQGLRQWSYTYVGEVNPTQD